jgi:hypothetical protein
MLDERTKCDDPNCVICGGEESADGQEFNMNQKDAEKWARVAGALDVVRSLLIVDFMKSKIGEDSIFKDDVSFAVALSALGNAADLSRTMSETISEDAGIPSEVEKVDKKLETAGKDIREKMASKYGDKGKGLLDLVKKLEEVS